MDKELVPLEDICHYFGISPNIARRKAAIGTLAVPAFRLNGKRGPMFVRKEDIDKYIEERYSKAAHLNRQMKMVGAAPT